jgi:hypothetical protein
MAAGAGICFRAFLRRPENPDIPDYPDYPENPENPDNPENPEIPVARENYLTE